MEEQQIKKELPHGSVKKIAERTGVSTSTVCSILKGKKSPQKATVLKVAAELLEDFKTKEREALKAMNKALTA